MSKIKTTFQILDLIQGSPEWKAERAKWVTASDMASIMGIRGAFKKRDTVLREKVNGLETEVSDFVQEMIFDPGHAAEGPLRQAAADQLSMEFCDAVVVNEKMGLLASMDCVNFKECVIVETKLSKAEKVLGPAREGKAWEPYRVQVHAQMIATGFRRAYLFVMDAVTSECHLVPVPFDLSLADSMIVATRKFQEDWAAGRTNEITIEDVRMEKLSRLLHRMKDIEEEIVEPMTLLEETKKEVDAIKKAIAQEFQHTAIYGHGVMISKSKPRETLDKGLMEAAGIDLAPYMKIGAPAVTAKLLE